MCSTANNHFVVVSIIRPPFCKNVNMPSAQDFFNRFITGLPTRGTVCFYKCTKQPRRFLINVDEGTRLGRLQNTRAAEKNFLAKRSKIIWEASYKAPPKQWGEKIATFCLASHVHACLEINWDFDIGWFDCTILCNVYKCACIHFARFAMHPANFFVVLLRLAHYYWHFHQTTRNYGNEIPTRCAFITT